MGKYAFNDQFAVVVVRNIEGPPASLRIRVLSKRLNGRVFVSYVCWQLYPYGTRAFRPGVSPSG